MKKVICILFILYRCSVFSQDIVFNNTYSDGNSLLLRNILSADNQYIGLGGEYNEFGKIDIFIAVFDIFGNWHLSKNYGDSIFNYYHGDRNSLIENDDGGFSLAGTRTGQGNITCMLTKFDQNFDTLWTRLYFDNPDFTAFYNHIQTPDGGYALVGSNDETDPDGDVLLVKTDSEGNMEWYKKYGTSDRDIGLCIVETEDGGYLIGGNSSSYGEKDGYVLKTDSFGNLEWTKHYGNSLYPDGTIYTILKTESNDYYIALSNYVTDPISSSFYNRRYGIVKLDSDFNEVWNNVYGVRAEYTGLGSITVANNGDVMATVTDDHISGLMRISAEGDSISTIYYSTGESVGENALLAIKQTPDNGFIMAGVAYEPQVMWIVKTDSCGCVVEDCECGGSAVQQVFANNEITFYPNPAGNVLHFDMPERAQDINIEIYDNLGRLLITNELFGWENSIDVCQLNQGNYFVRIIADGEYWSGWFVKE